MRLLELSIFLGLLVWGSGNVFLVFHKNLFNSVTQIDTLTLILLSKCKCRIALLEFFFSFKIFVSKSRVHNFAAYEKAAAACHGIGWHSGKSGSVSCYTSRFFRCPNNGYFTLVNAHLREIFDIFNRVSGSSKRQLEVNHVKFQWPRHPIKNFKDSSELRIDFKNSVKIHGH